MDHYKTLGLRSDATKEEIKEAFRRSALRFHPDRHSNSSEEVKDSASVRFKQASEAYEVLIDERRRADYDRAWRGAGSFDRRGYGGYSSSKQYGYGYGGGGGGGYRRPPGSTGGGGLGFDMGVVFRVLTRRGFLINVGFARAVLVLENEEYWNICHCFHGKCSCVPLDIFDVRLRWRFLNLCWILESMHLHHVEVFLPHHRLYHQPGLRLCLVILLAVEGAVIG